MLPECQLALHVSCKTGGVHVLGENRVAAGTPGAVLVIPAKRCDCPCHGKEVAR
ncbi:hypothetical protein ACN9M0_24720 [Streptomyces sp. R-07]|uniref:hypothetical protein n=1 Tax=Streptomyces sp. R-07 TaxID=3404052 RepID=UPI003CF15095